MQVEATRKHMLHHIVQVVAFNQPVSLISSVLGCPAVVCIQVVSSVLFHVLPDWLPLHWHWVFVWQEQQFAYLVHYNPTAPKLACRILDYIN